MRERDYCSTCDCLVATHSGSGEKACGCTRLEKGAAEPATWGYLADLSMGWAELFAAQAIREGVRV